MKENIFFKKVFISLEVIFVWQAAGRSVGAILETDKADNKEQLCQVCFVSALAFPWQSEAVNWPVFNNFMKVLEI